MRAELPPRAGVVSAAGAGVVSVAMATRVSSAKLAAPRLPVASVLALGLLASASAARGLWLQAHGGQAAFDLGIFSQAVAHYAHGQLPASAIRRVPDLLGDHFSPLLAVLGPLWLLWPSPDLLIVVQAVCLGLGGLPVLIYARRRLSARRAGLVVVAYAGWFGFGSASVFGFHEYALAVPLVGLLVLALRSGRSVPAVVAGALACLVREDVALLVIVVALVEASRSPARRVALALAAGAAGYLLLVMLVVQPLIVPGGSVYGPILYPQLVADPWLLVQPWRWGVVLRPLGLRLEAVRDQLLAWAGLPLLSRLAVPLALLLALRVAAVKPALWTDWYQYGELPGPLLALAAVDGLAALERLRPLAWVASALLALCVLVELLASPLWPWARVPELPPQSPACLAAVRALPAGQVVELSGQLATQAIPRDEVYLLGMSGGLAAIAVLPSPPGAWPAAVRRRGFHKVASVGGCSVWRRSPGHVPPPPLWRDVTGEPDGSGGAAWVPR